MNEAEFNPDVIEAALAHNDKNEVRRAYNRSTYLDQRKELIKIKRGINLVSYTSSPQEDSEEDLYIS